MSDKTEELLKQLQQAELAFNLRQWFVQALSREGDDWSFVIKTHALIEACVSELLVTAIGNDRVRSVITRLDLSDTQRGTLALAKQLEVLPEGCSRFVRAFSELRNICAHNVHNVNFTFTDQSRHAGPQ